MQNPWENYPNARILQVDSEPSAAFSPTPLRFLSFPFLTVLQPIIPIVFQSLGASGPNAVYPTPRLILDHPTPMQSCCRRLDVIRQR